MPDSASNLAHIATPTCLKGSTFTESPLRNTFTPSIDGSTADMIGPMPLSLA